MTDRADQRAEEGLCRTTDQERRAMCQMLFHWLERHTEAGFPTAAQLDLESRPDLLHHAFTLDLASKPGRMLVATAGSLIGDICGRDPIGLCATQAFPAPFREHIPHLCENLTAFGKPISDSASGFKNGREFAYRAILIPLGDGNPRQRIDRALGSMTFRWMP